MIPITLDIPDALAERVAQRRDQLPQLLAMALELFPGDAPFSLPVSPSDHPVFAEMLDFLASGPTPAQIVAFKLSPAAQARLETLLDTHREEGLTAEETAELEVYAQVNHLLLLLKARARLATAAPQWPRMPSIYIPVALRRHVRQRAQGRCEYCLLHQDDVPLSHHIDHILPRKHGGHTVSSNLALACLDCKRSKGSDLSAIDSATGAITPLFNPRVHVWQEHFALEGARIVGLTSVGRAMVILLQFNAPRRVIQRRVLIDVGRYPPHA